MWGRIKGQPRFAAQLGIWSQSPLWHFCWCLLWLFGQLWLPRPFSSWEENKVAEHRAGTRLGRGRMQGGHRAGKKQKPSYLMASVHHLRTVTAENEALRGLHFLSVTQSSHYHAAGSQRYRIQEHSSHQPIVISFQEHRNSLILHLRAYLASRYRLTHSPPPVRSLPLGCIATLTDFKSP